MLTNPPPTRRAVRAVRAALAVLPAVLAAVACGASQTAPPRPAVATAPRPAAPHPAPTTVGGAPLAATDADAGAACGEQTSFDYAEQAATQRAQTPDASGWQSGESRVKTSADACGIADDNLKAAEDAILAQPARAPGGAAAPPPAAPWDRKTPPLYLDRIDRRFRLTAAEKAILARNGFVVSSRLDTHAYGWHLHEIFQSELPVYVSADALFHAVYIGNDSLLRSVEGSYLSPMLQHVLLKLTCALPAAAADYPPDVARDLDVYLAVATALLAGSDATPATAFGQNDLASTLASAAKDAKGMAEVSLFGRDRMIDWSQYQPRGHYAPDPNGMPALDAYFRASMWLSRLELNLVSRSSRSSQPGEVPNPEETPREAIDALALADLVGRAGVSAYVDALDHAWGALAGRREDVSIAQLAALRQKAQITSLKDPGDFARLKAAIGDDFQRTARLHWMPQGSPNLPVIATFLGPRVVPDTVATRPLVHDELPNRTMIHSLDMAYVLGDDRAKMYLAADRQTFPTLDRQLDVARAIVQKPLPEGDLYSGWFGAVRALALEAPVPAGAAAPSFMSTAAFADARLGSVIAAFGQVRHNYVLLTGQGYDAYGCEIPDGWVEPAPDAYDAVVRYAERGAQAMRGFDPQDHSGAASYFERMGRLFRVFRAISASELAGRPLSTDERRFLAMVAEYLPQPAGCDSCPPPTYTGWWFDLFMARVKDGLSPGAFMADYYTSTNEQRVAYVGATAPRLGVFVVDTGGPPRAFVGPVSNAFEYVGSTDKRLADGDADAAAKTGSAPWAASYTAGAPQEPPLELQVESNGVVAKSTRALGAVTIEILDHHRVPVAKDTRAVDTREARFTFGGRMPPKAEGIAVTIGDFHYVWAVPPFTWVESYTLGEMRPKPEEGQ